MRRGCFISVHPNVLADWYHHQAWDGGRRERNSNSSEVVKRDMRYALGIVPIQLNIFQEMGRGEVEQAMAIALRGETDGPVATFAKEFHHQEWAMRRYLHAVGILSPLHSTDDEWRNLGLSEKRTKLTYAAHVIALLARFQSKDALLDGLFGEPGQGSLNSEEQAATEHFV